jgi:hypothetical protein
MIKIKEKGCVPFSIILFCQFYAGENYQSQKNISNMRFVTIIKNKN